MIFSQNHKFIFIKTVKTAGKIIELNLARLCGFRDVVTPIYPEESSHVARNHYGVWTPIPELLVSRLGDLENCQAILSTCFPKGA